MTTKTTTTTATTSTMAKVTEKTTSAMLTEKQAAVFSDLCKYYSVDRKKVDFQYMTDSRLANYLFLKYQQEIANLERQINALEESANNPETDNGEKAIAEIKLQKAGAKMRNMLPLLKQGYDAEIDSLYDSYSAIKAYAVGKTSNLHTSNAAQCLAECEKFRGYIKYHSDKISDIVSGKKTADTKNLYLNMKSDLQAIVNLLLVGSNLTVEIKPDFVSSIAGMYTCKVREGKNTNLASDSRGYKAATASAILKQICSNICDAVEPDAPKQVKKSHVKGNF